MIDGDLPSPLADYTTEDLLTVQRIFTKAQQRADDPMVAHVLSLIDDEMKRRRD